MSIGSHPYQPFLHRIRKPAQYLGGEPGQRVKDWGAAKARICLAFPDLYEIGMSHLGYRILYGLINDVPELIAERAYAPWDDMEAMLREHGERLRSLESAQPLSEFDVVGFSLQYELTYTNILLMLDLGGIPLRSSDRGDADPLVVAGGPVATHAEPIAPFVDAFLIGDGEVKAKELLDRWAEMRDANVPRADRLRAIATMGGFYVPSLYESEVDSRTGLGVVVAPSGDSGLPFPIERTWLPSLDEHPFPSDLPVATTETVFDRVSVEIARGCTEGCRFCQAGMIYRPVRERKPRDVIDTLLRSVDGGGYDEASLTCLSTADYSAVTPLVHRLSGELQQRGVTLSVSSLRAYGLSEEILDDMKQQRAGGLTFAPEAGTQRMRDVINKNVTEEQLLLTADRVFSRGWSKLKLYFMLGLPTEEDEDVVGILETAERTLDVGRRILGKGRARVTASVSTLVPKPHTPFQWAAMTPYEEIRRKQRLLRERIRGSKVQLRMHDCSGSWLEGVLARGDRRLANIVLAAYEAGARFDSWDERLDLSIWERAFESFGLEPSTFLGTLPVDAPLPWSHIDVGLEKGFLEREYRRALKNRLSPPCSKPVGASVHPTNVASADDERRKLICYNCGVACDLDSVRERRRDALVELGAHRPRAVPSIDAPPSESQERRPMASVDQGPGVRLRIGFTKVGRMAFGSHLDLVRLMPRIFRRVDLPLFYSEGFHPKPVMTFTPALSLGVSSLVEHVDLKLRARDLPREIDLEAWRGTMNERSYDGLRIVGLRMLEPGEPAISRSFDHYRYIVGLPNALLREHGFANLDEVARRIEERRTQELSVERQREKKTKTIEVGRYLLDAQLGFGAELLGEAGFVGDLLPLDLTIAATTKGSCKPSEAVLALLDIEESLPTLRADLYRLDEGRRRRPLDPPSRPSTQQVIEAVQ